MEEAYDYQLGSPTWTCSDVADLDSVIEADLVIGDMLRGLLEGVSPVPLTPRGGRTVDESPMPPPSPPPPPAPGRFTSRLRLRTVLPQPEASPPRRPGRLEGAIAGLDGDPFSEGRRGAGALGTTAEGGGYDDIPAFRHLAALERAVASGEAFEGRLPPLPFAQAEPVSPRPQAAKIAAAASRPDADADPWGRPAAPRVLFREGTWGLQPPFRAGSRKPGAALGAFRRTALRGAALPGPATGAAATARWVATEGARLRSEVPRSLGCSHTIAFLASNGPKRVEDLSAPLCREDLLR